MEDINLYKILKDEDGNYYMWILDTEEDPFKIICTDDYEVMIEMNGYNYMHLDLDMMDTIKYAMELFKQYAMNEIEEELTN